jgi:glutamine cyclotransferase
MRLLLLAALALTACAQPAQQSQATVAQEPPVQQARVVRAYPHDPRAFTQGLIWMDGKMFESTGMVGASTLREVNLADGRVIRSTPFPPGNFGEGITAWGNEILGITWQDGIGYRWDRNTFRQTGTWRYNHEGWGLTHDGRSIIMSDGTADLRFLDPVTMAEQRRLTVTSGGNPVPRLNELEYVNGEILANVWQSPMIARIDPSDGRVKAWIDLSAQVRGSGDNTDRVLNGIAWDPQGRRLFVTGKYWPKLYEIELPPLAANAN